MWSGLLVALLIAHAAIAGPDGECSAPLCTQQEQPQLEHDLLHSMEPVSPRSAPPESPTSPAGTQPHTLSSAADASQLSSIPASIPVTIQPPLLEFGGNSICTPSTKVAELINLSDDEDLEVLSISTSSVHFHPPHMEAVQLPPGGRMNLSIVFLPHEVGVLTASMLVQTSAGGFFYRMDGFSAPSPYHVRPILDVPLLSGGSFYEEIELYNPHQVALRVEEAITSEGFLHVGFPQSSLRNGTPADSVWHLAPGQSKRVVSVLFAPDQVAEPLAAGKYRAYVHLRTSVETLLIPVSVRYVKRGVVLSPSVLDFGTVHSATASSERTIVLTTNMPTPTRVLEVRDETPHPSLRVQPVASRRHGSAHDDAIPPMHAT